MEKAGRNVQWLWGASRGYRRRIVLCALLGTLRIMVSLAFVWLTKILIDLATDRMDAGLVPFFSNRPDPEAAALVAGIVAMLLCILIQLACTAARNRITTRVEISLRNSIRIKLLDHILKSRWTGRETFHTGDMLNRMEGDVTTVSSILGRSVPSAWITLFQLASSALFLGILNLRLALVVICIMPLLLVLSKFYIKRMRRLTSEIRKTDSKVQSYLQENLQHRTLISAFEYAPVVNEEMDSLQSGLERLVMKRNTLSIFSASMVSAGFSLGYLTAFGWGVWGISTGTVTFGTLTAFLQLVGQVQRPVVELSREIPAFINALTAVERLNELSSLPLEEQGAPLFYGDSPGIRFTDVSYSYPDSESPAIEHFAYDFVPGSLTAVVGETGGGKSTLVRLMLALLEPSAGTVEIYSGIPVPSHHVCHAGGRVADAPEEPQSAIVSPLTRGNFVYVPQGNSLISGTIRENLRLGDKEASDGRMYEALHSAAADFVRELPLGLDTPCGEMGAGLSEGQAQRIAIARGLLRPGGIILLDEPTSALDSVTERTLMSRLSESAIGKTMIVITHQSQTAEFCDNVVRITA